MLLIHCYPCVQEKLNIQAKELQKKMHIKMADVASGQFNFVVATNALRKAKKFQLDESDHLNLALKITIGKLSAIQDNAKKVDLLDRMLNNVCSSMVSYLPKSSPLQ